MDAETLKLLQALANHAREVAAQIQQPPPSNAITFSMSQDHDKKPQKIKERLFSVADAINAYVRP